MRYLIANWKSQMGPSESVAWLDRLVALHPRVPENLQVIIALPFTDLGIFNHRLSETPFPLTTASQDVSHLPPGKHTGEVTAQMLSGLVKYCLVGHSERRREFGETSAMVAEKASLLLENHITPVVCLDTPYLDSQIRALLENDVDVAHCLFVYEPIAAIGTGNPENPIEANHIANNIRFLLDGGAPVLYGGSVTSENALSFVSQSHIDGVLVGTSSLDPIEFASIIKQIS